MIRETLSAPMLFRREGVIMLDSIQSLLDSLPEGAVLIRQGTAVYINAMARQLLPQLSPGAPLPDFIALPPLEEAGTGLFVSGSTPYSFSCSSHQEDQLLLFRPAPQAVLDSRQLGGTLRQLRELLEAGGAVGRKLDFLIQEFNREANTIGSKCSDVEITRRVVDMKAEIEKIREQVQNLE